jgi:hypothetical protein
MLAVQACDYGLVVSAQRGGTSAPSVGLRSVRVFRRGSSSRACTDGHKGEVDVDLMPSRR